MLLPQIRLFSYQKLHLKISAIFSLPKRVFLRHLEDLFGNANIRSCQLQLRGFSPSCFRGSDLWGLGLRILFINKDNCDMIQKTKNLQERMDNYG